MYRQSKLPLWERGLDYVAITQQAIRGARREFQLRVEVTVSLGSTPFCDHPWIKEPEVSLLLAIDFVAVEAAGQPEGGYGPVWHIHSLCFTFDSLQPGSSSPHWPRVPLLPACVSCDTHRSSLTAHWVCWSHAFFHVQSHFPGIMVLPPLPCLHFISEWWIPTCISSVSFK